MNNVDCTRAEILLCLFMDSHAFVIQQTTCWRHHTGWFLDNKRNFLKCFRLNTGVALLSGTPEEDAKTRKQKKAANVSRLKVLH